MHRKDKSLEIYCKVLNSTTIVSGYAGYNLQGGTCDGSVLISFFSSLLKLVKSSYMVLHKKKELWLC